MAHPGQRAATRAMVREAMHSAAISLANSFDSSLASSTTTVTIESAWGRPCSMTSISTSMAPCLAARAASASVLDLQRRTTIQREHSNTSDIAQSLKNSSRQNSACPMPLRRRAMTRRKNSTQQRRVLSGAIPHQHRTQQLSRQLQWVSKQELVERTMATLAARVMGTMMKTLTSNSKTYMKKPTPTAMAPSPSQPSMRQRLAV
mmetsp:Transcript_14568/g.57204  ORF Transcript_14568/g.57204 Transcript_14568/m.57204 type:complete len:204 (+) Transcript_14568:52-663(+)